MKRTILLIFLGVLLSITTSCGRFLDIKPDQKLAIPHTLEHLRALLDSHEITMGGLSEIGMIVSDDYYLTDADWESLWSDQERNMYLWQTQNIFQDPSNDWYSIYRSVFYANSILDGLKKISVSDQQIQKDEWEMLKGSAHYIRAIGFLNAASVWSPAYDPLTAEVDLGIPLRLTADQTEKSVRSTLQETFDQIVADLKEAVAYLPINVSHRIRPSKSAAHAWLARTYQYMHQHEKAYAHADSSLRMYKSLTDYNTVMPRGGYTFDRFGDEVIHESNFSSITPVRHRARVDSLLYASYDDNDLRKYLFFENADEGSYHFVGSYSSGILFGGVTTAEMYLISAESLARMGQIEEAQITLNTLREHRFIEGQFERKPWSDSIAATDTILNERRKELVMRGIRWMDIKRLNKEGRDILMKRNIGGVEYTLPPNDFRYALPIPEDIIQLSGMDQNPY